MPQTTIREAALPPRAAAIYEQTAGLPITSPHGHCDPAWFADDLPFPDPATLLVTPDHYVFRMLYSHGVPLSAVGLGPEAEQDPRRIFQTFADHWHAFLGTPSRGWIEYTLHRTLGIETKLTPATAMAVYDAIADRLADPAFRPRAAFDRIGIETLATTDAALDALSAHRRLEMEWPGKIIPTFRPDDVLNPALPGFAERLVTLGAMTDTDIASLPGYLTALRARRAAFRDLGATATDHDAPELMTQWLSRAEIEALYDKALKSTLSPDDASRFYGHMLTEMAQMSCEDGLVMQLHAGSRRSTNRALFQTFGPDMGADIPVAMDWVRGLDALLNRVGNDRRFRLLVFTLDEATYARELAPMAGHWPCLRLGPPWWFHDSLNGIRRYFDAVVETAGYHNLAGFNDDTRAFLSIPARHDMWRRGVALHLADQQDRGLLTAKDCSDLAPLLARDLARDAYRLDP